MLSNFYKSIEVILSNNQTNHDQIKALRDLTWQNIADQNFMLDCIEQTLHSIKFCTKHGITWHAPHFFYHEKLKFSVKMIFWPAYYANNPHQHKTWSVTGVLHNTLNINTYRLANYSDQPELDRTINATAGQAGYLLPGCIHNICNHSHEISASLHIFNHIDIANPENNAIWYPSSQKHHLLDGLLTRALTACLNIVAEINNGRALALMNDIKTIGYGI